MKLAYKYPHIPEEFKEKGVNDEYFRLAYEYGLAGEGTEPSDLDEIRALRPYGARRLWNVFDTETYRDRLDGAFTGRMAGCTLGAIVEFWSVDSMEKLARENGDSFPPVDYWTKIPNPDNLRYGKSKCSEYTRDELDGIPVDDDITYTQLGLLIAEDHGINFNTDDVGQAWLKYLPYACTAEDVALRNLKAGIPAAKVADIGNPFVQWIGADIRSDPFAYMAPAYPEFAAQMAYYDACISHRRNGVYGEMYFSAVESAAFAVDDPMRALELGLTEIPRDCLLARDLNWALSRAPSIRDHAQARAEVEAYFGNMSGVHTNLNAALTVFGISIGGRDFTRAIGETVAMGYDNDCTGATVGSIVGAVIGKKNIPEYWYKNFNNICRTYLNGIDFFRIDDLLNRFEAVARKVYAK